MVYHGNHSYAIFREWNIQVVVEKEFQLQYTLSTIISDRTDRFGAISAYGLRIEREAQPVLRRDELERERLKIDRRGIQAYWNKVTAIARQVIVGT